jgi:hypothetical protein
MDVKEAGKRGGLARKLSTTQAERIEIARKAGKASGKARRRRAKQ